MLLNFTNIDKENWNRKEYFDHYYSELPCTYSMSVKLEITAIKKDGRDLYPTLLCFITKIVNEHSEFRMSFDGNGNYLCENHRYVRHFDQYLV